MVLIIDEKPECNAMTCPYIDAHYGGCIALKIYGHCAYELELYIPEQEEEKKNVKESV